VTVAVDQGFVAHLVAGRVHVVPEIDRLDGREVVLRDGSRLRPDVILAATGFRTGLADLVGHLGVLDERGFPAARRPGLWFIGYQDRIEGILRQHPIEARRIARAVTHD